jgi:NADPH-dependent curcumin reductase CurA
MNEYADQFAVATEILARWLAEGKLKRSETIIKGGLAVAEEALAGIFTGTNTGKSTKWQFFGRVYVSLTMTFM